MARPSPPDTGHSTTLVTLASLVLVVGILYVAQEVLLPVAVSILLAFVLAPLTGWLERLRLPRIASVLAAVTLSFAIFGALAWMVTGELVDLARDVPKYQMTLIDKIRSLRELPIGGGLLAGLTDTVDAVTREMGVDDDSAARPDGSRDPREPVPVRIVERSPFALGVLAGWLGPLLGPLSTAALVLVFVIFILLAREDLRNRMIRLAGTGNVYTTTQALDEAGERISRYLVMQLIINTTYGAAVTVGLALIGVPSAVLWGLLAAVMRFVPYVGPWIAAILPIALALAVFEGWHQPLAAVGLFLVLELVSNNVMEPWLYGSSTGVSAVGIIASAVFWTWLWGPLGLVLSTPLTVCLTVLGRHAPRLGFLNVLLSDQPALEVDVRFYQRLLALDYNEASDLVAQFLKSSTLDNVYGQLFVPALSLAEMDRHAGHLTPDQQEFIYRAVWDLMREAERQFDTSATSETVAPGTATILASQTGTDSTMQIAFRVMCLPAEDEADRLAGTMLQTLLRARGHHAETAEHRAASEQTVARLRDGTIDCVVISGVAPGGAMQARDASRQITAATPNVSIVVGLWNASGSLEGTRARLQAAGADVTQTGFAQALEFIDMLARTRTGVDGTARAG